MAHTRNSRPDYGLGFRVESLRPLQLFPLRSVEGCHLAQDAIPPTKARLHQDLQVYLAHKQHLPP